jgi:hypothetical protein
MFSIIKKDVTGNPIKVLDIINNPIDIFLPNDPVPNPLELFYPKYYKKDYQLSNLKAGAILMCSLAFGAAEHTGVYIGKGKVAELKGTGEIRSVSLEEFISSTDVRTGRYAYAACKKNGDILISEAAVINAKNSLHDYWEYNLLTNNCHKFTAGCITGNFDNLCVAFTFLEQLINFSLGNGSGVRWRRIKE